MHARSPILVVAATARELAPVDGWIACICGVGPADAAAQTAAAIAAHRPAAVLNVGIAGARRSAALDPPTLVIGEAALYCDLEVPERLAPRLAPASPVLLDAARRALPDAPVRVIGTSAKVGGAAGCDIEAMEGFGVLRAAALAGVPAIEVRAVSNAVEEHDRSRWRFDEAFAAIIAATPRLVAEFAQCVR
jgi:nucleoside phosphorylase